MPTRSVTAVAAAVALGAAPATMAKDRDSSAARDGGPPTIDIQRLAEKTLTRCAPSRAVHRTWGVPVRRTRGAAAARQRVDEVPGAYQIAVRADLGVPAGLRRVVVLHPDDARCAAAAEAGSLQHPRGGRPAPIARSSGWSLLEQRVPGGQVHRERPSPTANSIAVMDSGRRPRELEINRPRRRCRATQLRCQGQG
jgi:hypothetical protein